MLHEKQAEYSRRRHLTQYVTRVPHVKEKVQICLMCVIQPPLEFIQCMHETPNNKTNKRLCIRLKTSRRVLMSSVRMHTFAGVASGGQGRSCALNLPLVMMTILLAHIMKGLSSNTCTECLQFPMDFHTSFAVVMSGFLLKWEASKGFCLSPLYLHVLQDSLEGLCEFVNLFSLFSAFVFTAGNVWVKYLRIWIHF